MVTPLLLASLVFAAAPQSGSASSPTQIELIQGKSTLVTLPFQPASGANSNPESVQAVLEGRKIIFVGKKLGVADYTLFDATKKRTVRYEIRVVRADLAEVARNVREIVPDGVRVTVAGDRVLVEGEVVTDAEMSRVKAAVEGREGVINLVRYSDAAVKAAAKTIEQQINDR